MTIRVPLGFGLSLLIRLLSVRWRILALDLLLALDHAAEVVDWRIRRCCLCCAGEGVDVTRALGLGAHERVLDCLLEGVFRRHARSSICVGRKTQHARQIGLSVELGPAITESGQA